MRRSVCDNGNNKTLLQSLKDVPRRAAIARKPAPDGSPAPDWTSGMAGTRRRPRRSCSTLPLCLSRSALAQSEYLATANCNLLRSPRRLQTVVVLLCYPKATTGANRCRLCCGHVRRWRGQCRRRSNRDECRPGLRSQVKHAS